MGQPPDQSHVDDGGLVELVVVVERYPHPPKPPDEVVRIKRTTAGVSCQASGHRGF